MTAITKQAKDWLTDAWASFDLPSVDFSGWSLEYAREISWIIRVWTDDDMIKDFEKSGQDPTDQLILALDLNDVFDPEPSLHQWVPAKR